MIRRDVFISYPGETEREANILRDALQEQGPSSWTASHDMILGIDSL